jgi:hypothetical protein
MEKKEESRKEAEEKSGARKKLFQKYKDGRLDPIHQRICEIIFSSVQEGETGVINVEKWRQEENITSLTFRMALKFLNLLGYIEILPITRRGDTKGTTIKVNKAYNIPPPSEKMMSIYNYLRKRRRVKDGKQTEITLFELGVNVDLTPRMLKKNIIWLECRRHIKIIEIDEKEGILKFCFTSHKPQSEEEKAQTQKKDDTGEGQNTDAKEEE